jgi:hypothetical protein
VNIVRKIDNPSCWRAAPLQGFSDDKFQGPRTHGSGKYVSQGRRVDFAFRDLFDMDHIAQVWLSIQLVEPTKKKKQDRYLVMCQFCARNFKNNREK